MVPKSCSTANRVRNPSYSLSRPVQKEKTQVKEIFLSDIVASSISLGGIKEGDLGRRRSRSESVYSITCSLAKKKLIFSSPYLTRPIRLLCQISAGTTAAKTANCSTSIRSMLWRKKGRGDDEKLLEAGYRQLIGAPPAAAPFPLIEEDSLYYRNHGFKCTKSICFGFTGGGGEKGRLILIWLMPPTLKSSVISHTQGRKEDPILPGFLVDILDKSLPLLPSLRL